MRLILLILFYQLTLFANEPTHLYSPLSIPNKSIVDTNISECDNTCLQELLDAKKPFSFLSKYPDEIDDHDFKAFYHEYKTILGLEEERNTSVKIALLVPSQTIGRYAIEVSKSIMAYLLHYQIPFQFKVFDAQTEDEHNLLQTITQIEKEGYKDVIAPMTQKGANALAYINHSLEIYIPTVNQKNVTNKNFMHYYGGIDYAAQIEKLKPYIQKKLFVFDQKGEISQEISKASVKGVEDIPIMQITLNKRVIKYKHLFDAITFENNSTAILNTQPIKSSLLLSQFIYQDINLSHVLSTQLSYSPLLLNLTQSHDVKNLIIANSLIDVDENLQEANQMVGSDIRYDWINYATTRFVHHIVSKKQTITHSEKSLLALPILNHQIQYEIELLDAKNRRFQRITPLEVNNEL